MCRIALFRFILTTQEETDLRKNVSLAAFLFSPALIQGSLFSQTERLMGLMSKSSPKLLFPGQKPSWPAEGEGGAGPAERGPWSSASAYRGLGSEVFPASEVTQAGGSPGLTAGLLCQEPLTGSGFLRHSADY